MEKSIHLSHLKLFPLSFAFLLSSLALCGQDLRWIDKEASLKASSLDRLWKTSSTISTNSTASTIDIVFHRLILNLDPGKRYITGSVSTYFKTLPGYSRHIVFDMHDSLQVNAVKYHGMVISSWQHSGNKLNITLPTLPNLACTPEGVDSVMVDYQGVPFDDGEDSFSIEYHDGVPILATLSEPYGAMTWWPCKQDLNDKIDSVHLVITVPPGNRAASNGMLIAEQHCEDRSIYQWKHKHPIAAYLVGVAVTNYVQFSNYVKLDNIGRTDSIEILNYVYPEQLNQIKIDSRQIMNPFRLFNSLFGLYPFANERYGHAMWEWGGGMEHQTMSFMGVLEYDLMAHELAHQWFGDFVTCGSWQDIWLNEGFATYLTGLCYERDQEGIYWNAFKDLSIKRVLREPGGSVYCYDTTSTSRIFSARLSYSKGAMVLHMLRWEMGDEAFFRGMNNYLYDPRFANGYAKTADFQSVMETAADTSFQEFFNDWVYGEGYPRYTIKYKRGEGTSIDVTLEQTQSHGSVGFFEMDVPVRVIGGEGERGTGNEGDRGSGGKEYRLKHEYSGQVFHVDPGFVVDTVLFDPERWICTNNPVILGVDEVPLDQKVRIYPNPVNDILMIEFPPATAETQVLLYDVNGRKVAEKRILPMEMKCEISVRSLPEGVYQVRIGGEKEGYRIVVR